MLDCEWLQYLHSVGLLRDSFHPPEAVATVRTVLRHKASLVQMASSHVLHMQKALTQVGMDLTAIPGVEVGTIYTLLAECGRDLSAFPTAGDFASWLGFCPDNRITGGKVLSTRTRKVKHPLATALRLAAQALHHSRCALESTQAHWWNAFRGGRLDGPAARRVLRFGR